MKDNRKLSPTASPEGSPLKLDLKSTAVDSSSSDSKAVDQSRSDLKTVDPSGRDLKVPTSTEGTEKSEKETKEVGSPKSKSPKAISPTLDPTLDFLQV